jgi:riboflavin kinase/FMN adenylyltransferase
MVFEPHPRQFFRPDIPLFRLTPLPLKLELFEAFGLDFAAVLDFDASLAALSASEFVDQVLIGGLGLGHAVAGYDFHFGKDRKGTPEVMLAMGEARGFGVSIVEPVGEGSDHFSSSAIRDFLGAGDMAAAAEMLGYWWRLRGAVIRGAGRGLDLGFPTANIAIQGELGLAQGIYAVRVYHGDVRLTGAAYFGVRPTFGETEAAIEVFLFDFDGDLYGQDIEIEFIAHLRDDEAFSSEADLKAQMARDCEAARAVLARVDGDDPMLRFPLGRALAQA